jgi:hypothetical protein
MSRIGPTELMIILGVVCCISVLVIGGLVALFAILRGKNK